MARVHDLSFNLQVRNAVTKEFEINGSNQKCFCGCVIQTVTEIKAIWILVAGYILDQNTETPSNVYAVEAIDVVGGYCTSRAREVTVAATDYWTSAK